MTGRFVTFAAAWTWLPFASDEVLTAVLYDSFSSESTAGLTIWSAEPVYAVEKEWAVGPNSLGGDSL